MSAPPPYHRVAPFGFRHDSIRVHDHPAGRSGPVRRLDDGPPGPAGRGRPGVARDRAEFPALVRRDLLAGHVGPAADVEDPDHLHRRHPASALFRLALRVYRRLRRDGLDGPATGPRLRDRHDPAALRAGAGDRRYGRGPAGRGDPGGLVSPHLVLAECPRLLGAPVLDAPVHPAVLPRSRGEALAAPGGICRRGRAGGVHPHDLRVRRRRPCGLSCAAGGRLVAEPRRRAPAGAARRGDRPLRPAHLAGLRADPRPGRRLLPAHLRQDEGRLDPGLGPGGDGPGAATGVRTPGGGDGGSAAGRVRPRRLLETEPDGVLADGLAGGHDLPGRAGGGRFDLSAATCSCSPASGS